MSEELPPGWAMAKLGDLCIPYEVVDPRRRPMDTFKYVDIGCIDNCSHQLLEPKTFLGSQAPSRARRLLKQDDVLFSTVRPYLKNIAKVNAEHDCHLTSTGIAVLRPGPVVDSNFLFWTVIRDSFVNEINSKTDGSLYPAVRDSDILDAEIALPPFNEQRRIVARIEELTARSKTAKEALQAIPPLLEKFRQSVLAAAFRGDLTAEWRRQNPHVEPAEVLLERIRAERKRRWQESGAKGKYQDPPPIDPTNLPPLPQGWCWASVDQVSWEVTVGFVGPMKQHYSPVGVPFLRSLNVRPNSLKLDGLCNISREFHLSILKSSLHAGDVVTVRTGDPGATCVIPKDFSELNCSDLVITRLASNSLLHPWLFSLFVNSPFAKSQIWHEQVGIAQRHFNVGSMKLLCCPILPREEQMALLETINSFLGGIEKTERICLHYLTGLKSLEMGLLNKAFRGELVPQDPNDEPASVLLERLAAQKSDAPPKARRKQS